MEFLVPAMFTWHVYGWPLVASAVPVSASAVTSQMCINSWEIESRHESKPNMAGLRAFHGKCMCHDWSMFLHLSKLIIIIIFWYFLVFSSYVALSMGMLPIGGKTFDSIIKGNVENKYNDITLAFLICLKYPFKEVKILRQLPRKTIVQLFLLHLLRLLQATLARLHLCLTYLQEGNYNHQTWWHWWANLQQEPATQEVIHLWFDHQLPLPLSRILTSKLWKTDWKPPWPKSWKSWPKTSKHHGSQQQVLHKWTLPRL